MSLNDHLDKLRQHHADIETAAYMDIGSGMVLYTSAAVRLRQEKLDALCVTAGTLMGGADGSTAVAVSLNATKAYLMQRSPDESSEVICVVCAPDAKIDEILKDVAGVFDEKSV